MKLLWKRSFIFTLAAILVAFVFYIVFRDPILKKAIDKRIGIINKTHKANISYRKVCFKGLTNIQFDSLSVTTDSNDTLLLGDKLLVGLNLRQLVSGHISFRRLAIEHAFIDIDLNKIDSYLSAFSKTKETQSNDSSKIDLYQRTEWHLKRVFASIPSKLLLRDISITYSRDSLMAESYVEILQLNDGKLTSTVKLTGNNRTQGAYLEGTVNPKQRTIELSINPKEKGTMLYSPLAGLFEAKVHYQSLKFDFIEKEKKDKKLRLEGNLSLGQFEIDYKALSSNNITFPGFSMKFNLSVGTNFMELDSLTEIKFGKLTLNPFLKYSISPSDSFTFMCTVPTFTVNDFFNSLPTELLPDLKYFEADGSLSYHTKLLVDLKQPDSLRLEANLNSKNFKLNHIDAELTKMNTSFVYTAYEKGMPVRSILVGTDNPDYLPLKEVPLLLQNAILLAEDNAFYSHNGFSIESIRYALVKNIKEKKFARGGSTISQQLIKNVYLSREKTISRKLEEIILVWLIESNRLVSKSRMFEVYLNIIEWGPGIYGVNEAARFYFSKNAKQLNAAECIFLASIIPSPKKFYWRFDKEGHLAPFMMQYYNNMSAKLLNRGFLISANGDSLASLLNITGQAKRYLKLVTPQVDSIKILDISDEDFSE